MVEAYRKRQNAIAVRGRIGESDMCRLYPSLNGIHSSGEADRLSMQEIDEGQVPADADAADLGVSIRIESLRDQKEELI